MLISVVQNSVFLSDAEAHQCIWASTVNWRGGARNNIEIDLLQENKVHGSTGSDAFSVVAFTKKAMDATNRKL